MSDINDLLQLIQNSIDLANQLSQDPSDNFALCATSLTAARSAISTTDRSAECRCPCHTVRPDWHGLPCGCYTGNPVLE
jgi:hypothetical protein